MQPVIHAWRDASMGLEAVLVVDDTHLGPPVGGTRTKAYASWEAAVEDARALARAMTLKCALAGLAAGGCKIVVREPPIQKRAHAFEALGRRIAALPDRIYTAGDYGTRPEDLACMARFTDRVHLAGDSLTRATARGLLGCVEACARRRDRHVASLTIAVQGCGAIGSSVVEALAAAGARLLVADCDLPRAELVAQRSGARVVAPEDVLLARADVVVPCATGGVLTEAVASRMQAWAVVGAANNILHGRAVLDVLRVRDILFVPDVVSSAGAVVDGIGELVMGLADRTALVDGLGVVARRVLDRAEVEDIDAVDAAERIAAERLGRLKRLLVV